MARIRHIAVYTDRANVENLVQFYCDVFGFTVAQRVVSGSVFVTDGYLQLALLVMEACVGEDAKYNGLRGKGIDHFGITLEPSEVETVQRKLTEHGVTQFSPPEARAYVNTGFLDVEGNKVDLSTSQELRQLQAKSAAT